jgi:S1-C subfamily serine protease
VCVGRDELLASARVVGDAKRVTVVGADGEARHASVVGVDRESDLALLQVDWVATPARLAPSPAAPGDRVWIVAAASPPERTPWLSTGIVSSGNGMVSLPDGPAMSGVLVTDASASPSAGGGALVTADGAVTGIVLAPVMGASVAYAIPIAHASRIADALHSEGAVTHGALGLEGVDAPAGPTVTDVVARGPAAAAGVEEGDVLVSVAGRPVLDMSEVTAAVRSHAPGDEVTIVVRTRGRDHALHVVLGEHPG